MAADLAEFLRFKRSLGYRYQRAEFMLRAFDRFLLARTQDAQGRVHLQDQILVFLSQRPQRKPSSVCNEMGVFRQLYAFLQRRFPHRRLPKTHWPKLPSVASFVPCVPSRRDVCTLIRRARALQGPPFRADLYRALLLVMYCTGLRFGEALRLRICDVDLRRERLFIRESKGRSRWVPFRRSLARELKVYMKKRSHYGSMGPEDRLFVGRNRVRLPVSTANGTITRLLREAGLKPQQGRVGPRPYDLRHAFAVHRLAQWYRMGVNLHERLPWLSAYMGHQDILGTETYLRATAGILGTASDRFRRLYLKKGSLYETTS